MVGFVLLHAGAGYHAAKKEQAYQALCDAACMKGIETMKNGGNATEAVVEVIKILEDSELTNAGIGSNLSVDGTVECDAMIATSEGSFASIGALQCIRNPIDVAKVLLDKQKTKPADGRLPSCCLVGEGAKQFAVENSIQTVDMNSMITESATKRYIKYKKIVDSHRGSKRKASQNNPDEIIDDESCSSHQVKRSKTEEEADELLDTVGAICFDGSSIAAGLSSGGIALKRAGRLGQAAMIGSGCWVEDLAAAVTTGSGEQLMKTLLAKQAVDRLNRMGSNCQENELSAIDHLETCLKHDFLFHKSMEKESQRFAGIVACKFSSSRKTIELAWGHTTKSMLISYMSLEQMNPHTVISRLSTSDILVADGVHFSI